MTENDRYEGFSIDLIKNIAIECKFKYKIIVKDIEVGKEENGHWTGVVGEIIDKVIESEQCQEQKLLKNLTHATHTLI